jgi:thioredoxin 1
VKEIQSELELNKFKKTERVIVLFYASWCPFSQIFLPLFEEYSRRNSKDCEFVRIDDNAELCDKYSVNFYPTVLCFEKGMMTRRIDAKPGVGLNKKQLEDFASSLQQ